MAIRALEFYSGIGGLHLALERSNTEAVVATAFDWDPLASLVYRANHATTPVIKIDISTLTALYLKGFNADLWLLSPACQPYTVLNPHAKGIADPRAKSLLHLFQDVLPELASINGQPKYILIENVAGFETSDTRTILLNVLKSLGYSTLEFLLTPLQFNVPNSRLRYYLIARHGTDTALPPPSNASILKHIPGPGNKFDWVDPRKSGNDDSLCTVAQLRDYLDLSNEEIDQSYAIPDRVLRKWGRLFDIVLPSDTRTCCFTRGYTNLVERTGSILQLNEALDTTEVFQRFLVAEASGDVDAVRILDSLKLRYFSPTELLRLFYFLPPSRDFGAESASPSSSTFIWPSCVSNKVKYRLIGNSVNVKVVTELINFLVQ